MIPAIIILSIAFFILWWIQSYNLPLATTEVLGSANFSFVYSMLIFPIVWIAGFVYTKYVSAKIYPLEDKLIEKFSKRKEDK